MAWHPSGNTLAMGTWPSNEEVRVFGSSGSNPSWSLQKILSTPGTNAANTVAYSPDGTLLAAGYATSYISVWEVGTWTEVATLSAHTMSVVVTS